MIVDLGLSNYEEAYRIQKEFVRRRRLGEIGDSVILTEHREVFTIGRRGSIANLFESEEVLASRGIKVLRVDRGGDITFHGPGQIIAYPIIDLRERGRDMHRYMRSLEDAAIGFLSCYGVVAGRIEQKTGVWVGREKIASIGIGASDWVTYHGLSVNIACDLGFFELIRPCGIDGARVTSLENILRRRISMDEAKGGLVASLVYIFRLEDLSYESCAAVA